MEKIIIPASKCIPGMITAAPIINVDTGTTILGANQELTSANIHNIINFVHTDIWIYLDSFNKVWNLPPETVETYKKYTNTLMALIGDISKSEVKDLSDFVNFCDTLPEEFTSNHSLLGCTHLIEQLDYTTFNHSLNVAFLSMLIAKWCNLDATMTSNIIKAALLHDIGLLNLSFNPFETPKPWDYQQQEEYERHSIFGYNLVSKLHDIDPDVAKAILSHHEHCDGSGFPIHISAPYINQIAKVLCLADTYELLKHETHVFNVLRILLMDRITQFDPKLLLNFCTHLATYYVGTFVILSDDSIGEVVFINPKCLYRPIVKINDQFMNLYEHPSIEIISMK